MMDGGGRGPWFKSVSVSYGHFTHPTWLACTSRADVRKIRQEELENFHSLV